MSRVLVIDDEMRTREGLKRHVNWRALNIGEVYFLENAQEALEIAERESIDLAVTDVRMPGMDGIEFAKKIKKMQPECEIIFISAFSDIEYLKAAIRLRVIDYVEKPLDVAELENAIRKALNRSSTKDEKAESRYIDVLRQVITSGSALEAQFAAANAVNGLSALDRSFEEIQGWCLDTVKMMYRAIFDCEVPQHQMEDVAERIENAETTDQILRTLCQLLVVFMEVDKTNGIGQPVRSTLMHIAINLDDPEISVSILAKKVFITPNYLSALFSRETGETINHFILHVRMVMAKYLLQDPRLKRFEIAKMLGLNDVNYFSKLFKKMTGISPSEYIAGGQKE